MIGFKNIFFDGLSLYTDFFYEDKSERRLENKTIFLCKATEPAFISFQHWIKIDSNILQACTELPRKICCRKSCVSLFSFYIFFYQKMIQPRQNSKLHTNKLIIRNQLKKSDFLIVLVQRKSIQFWMANQSECRPLQGAF